MAKKTNAPQANPLATIPTDTGTGMIPSGGDYLHRIKLCAELTTEVKEKKAEVGDFYLQGVENLGPEVTIVPVAARAHALRLKDGSSKVALESFVLDSPEFQAIKADRDADPRQQEPNNMYGNDWLIWLPDTRQFIIYYLNKMAFFKADGQFRRMQGKVAIMTARTENSKKNTKVTYKVPELAEADDQAYDAPTGEEYAAARAMFDNPKPQAAGSDADQTPASSPKGEAKRGGKKGR